MIFTPDGCLNASVTHVTKKMLLMSVDGYFVAGVTILLLAEGGQRRYGPFSHFFTEFSHILGATKRLYTVSGQNIIGIYIIPLVLIQHADSKQNIVCNNQWFK